MSTTTKVETLLERLRLENAERWEELKRLHHNANPTAASDEPSLRTLRMEFDLVIQQGEWKIESDKLLERISAASVSEDAEGGQEEGGAPSDGHYGAELVESYHCISNVNRQIQHAVHVERRRLATAMSVRDELSEFKSDLEYETRIAAASDGSVPRPGNGAGEDAVVENTRRRNDLVYVAELVQARLNETSQNGINRNRRRPKKSKSADVWSLSRLLLELLRRLVMAPPNKHSYLSLDSIVTNDQHISLLRQYELIETFEGNDSMIRLIDYRE